jgi:LemA protein
LRREANMYILIPVVVLAIITISIFNRLIRYRFLVGEAFSGIDVQLKRRHDLIPKIVDTVKGYAQYESKVLENITSMRSQLVSASAVGDKSKIENTLSQTLKSIFALAEAYPDLKANSSFLELQKTVSEIEDQIQMARRYYNGTVRDYNIMVASFPANLVASVFNFKSEEFFEIEYATERQVPDVDFSSQETK